MAGPPEALEASPLNSTAPRNPSGEEPSTTAGYPILAIVLGLLLLLLGPVFVGSLLHERESETISRASERLGAMGVLQAINQASRDVAMVVEPSVVHVSTEGYFERENGRSGVYGSSGSGWVYDAQGHVVTNAHVISSADKIEVQFSNGERRAATFIGSDVRSDIAVVRVDPGRIHPASRSSVMPAQGDLVFAFGSPFDFRFSMSSGIVSGLGRSAGLVGLDQENFIQVDAAVNPGNSGGPLCDIHGNVIGMNTAIATGRGSTVGEEGQFAGIALAIPMRMIELVVDQIISRGEVVKGFLGIQMSSLDTLALRPTSEAMRSVLRNFRGIGVAITAVPEGNPAAAAGVLPGDVLVSINGVPVPETDIVAAEIGFQSPGSTIDLEIWRWNPGLQEAERLTLPVTLAELDPSALYERQVEFLSQRGITELATFTPELASGLGMEWTPGVCVLRADPDSPIPVGSIITEVSRESVSSREDLYFRLQQAGIPPIFQRVPGSGSQVSLEVISPAGDRELKFLPI